MKGFIRPKGLIRPYKALKAQGYPEAQRVLKGLIGLLRALKGLMTPRQPLRALALTGP